MSHFLQRELRWLGWSREHSLKQASELHTDSSCEEEAMTGAPVTELGYKQKPYPKRSSWQHVDELGWHHEELTLVPKT